MNQPGNNFGGAVSLTTAGSGNATLQDANGLTLGSVQVAGNLQVTANASGTNTADLNLGSGTIGGNLTAVSNGGNILQASIPASNRLDVDGNTSLGAGSGNIVLTQPNDFSGPVTVVSAGNVTLVNSGNLVLGGVSVTGSVSLTELSGGFTLNQNLIVPGSLSLSAAQTLTLTALADISAGTGVTLSGGAGIVTAADITTSGGAILFETPTILSGNVVLSTSGGNITFANTLNGQAPGGQDLEILAGSGTVLFDGAVGMGSQGTLGDILLGSAGTVDFDSDLDVDAPTVLGGVANVEIARAGDSIGGATVFNNSGTITLGQLGAVNFVQGVTAVLPSQTITLLGNVTTENGGISFGKVLIGPGADVSLLPRGGDLTLGSVSGTAGGLAGSISMFTEINRSVTILGDVKNNLQNGSFATSVLNWNAGKGEFQGDITVVADEILS